MSRIGFRPHREHLQVRGVEARVALTSPTVRLLRYLWAGPVSCVGLLLAALGVAAGGRISWHTGVLEAEGRLLAWGLGHLTLLEGGASAITFGHVVLGTSRAALDSTRAHERVHVRQYERWGPLFIPLYVAASLLAAIRGHHAYYDNPFERDAYTSEAHPDM